MAFSLADLYISIIISLQLTYLVFIANFCHLFEIIVGQGNKHVKILYMCREFYLHCNYWWFFWQATDV